MLQPLSPIDHVSYLDQHSDRKFRKKQEYHPVDYQKSPTRDSENRNILSNRPFTPAKKSGPNASPLKSMSSISSHTLSNIRELGTYSIKKSKINPQPVSRDNPTCHNHPAKPARYVIETEDQHIPYCQKCSILLASQGFKVVKLDESAVSVQTSFMSNKKEMVQLPNYERENEVNEFLTNLQSICANLKQKKIEAQTKVSIISQQGEEQVQEIETYFQELVEMMMQYKESMFMNVQKHTEARNQGLRKYVENVDECLEDAEMMKEDILTSLEIIQQVEDRMFRKVMESYKSREQSFKDQLIKPSSVGDKELTLEFLTNGARMEVLLHELAKFRVENQLPHPVLKEYNNHSMNSDNQNPIIQESSEEENLLKNNLSNNESYFKEFE